MARRLIEDPEYQKAVRERLVKAPPLEAQLWDRAYGRPRSEEPPAEARPDLGAILERVLARDRDGLAPRDPRE